MIALGQIAFLLFIYFAFFAYLMLAGVGLDRTLGILRQGVWQSLFAGALLGIIPLFFSPKVALQVFLIAAVVSSLCMLPVAALSRAREFILPHSSAFEVVCLNVLVVTIGNLPGGIFDQLFGLALRLLMNPLSFFIPPSLGWLNFALSLWPAVLALRLASLGEAASRKFRFVLMSWVQLIGILWLVPATLGGLVAANLKSVFGYVDILFASLGIVHFVFMWMTLRDAVFGERTTLILERSEDSTEKIGVARALADRMSPGPFSLPVLTTAGVLTFLAVRALMSLLPDANPALLGFFGVVSAGGLTQKFMGTKKALSNPVNWRVAASILVVVLVGLHVSNLLPRYGDRIRADIARAYNSSFMQWNAEPQTSCELTGGASPGLRCPDRFWPLGELPHPAGILVPANLDFTRGRHFRIETAGRVLHCQQISLTTNADAEVDVESETVVDVDRFVIAYVIGTASGREFGWSVERGGRCINVEALTFKATPSGVPSIAYRWTEQSRRDRDEYATSLFLIPPAAAPPSGQEQRAQP